MVGIESASEGFLIVGASSVVSVDFASVISRVCTAHDVSEWSGQCVQGVQYTYKRRKDSSLCLVSTQPTTSVCACSVADYEWFDMLIQ